MSANLISAVHDLVLESGLGAKNIAAAVGKPYSTLLREVNPFDDGAKLGAETLVDIMRVTGNIQPLEHIAEQFGYDQADPLSHSPYNASPSPKNHHEAHHRPIAPPVGAFSYPFSPSPKSPRQAEDFS